MFGSIRRALFRQLEPGAWGKGLSPVNRFIACLIVFAAIVAILETEVTVRSLLPGFFFYAEIFFISIFSIEYIGRLIAAGEHKKYAGFTGRLRYLFTKWSIIDLIAILPFILTLGGVNLVVVRLLKFLRLVRVLRLGPFGQAWSIMETAVSRRKYELLLSLVVAGLLLVLSASLVYLAEAKAQPDEFGSIPRALWWAVATLTTVGYGDVTPVTLMGRVFAGLAAAAGIGLVAMPTGVLAAAFSDAFQERRNKSKIADDGEEKDV